MSAIRLARGFTGRTKVIKFAGCYHGHVDSLLAAAGSGVATFALPDTPGVAGRPGRRHDRAAVQRSGGRRAAFTAHPGEIACVITEAAPGNMGVVPPVPGLQPGPGGACRQNGALFISDEVMTGFRVSPGRLVRIDGVDPDLMTFGKVMGGGFPAAAFGGRADVMAHLAPAGPVYQAGTLSGNPVATAAGLAPAAAAATTTATRRSTRGRADPDAGQRGARQGGRGAHAAARWQHVLGLLHRRPLWPTNYEEAKTQESFRFTAFFHAMLAKASTCRPAPSSPGSSRPRTTTRAVERAGAAAPAAARRGSGGRGR